MKQYLLFVFSILFWANIFGQTLLEEDFSVFPPNNWTRGNAVLNNVYNGSSISTINYGWYADTNGYGIAGNHAKTNIFGSSIKYWLISPTISLNGENNILTFHLATTNYNANTPANSIGVDDKFVVLVLEENQAITPNNELIRIDNTSPIRLENIGLDTLITLPLNNYDGNVRIGFYVESLVDNSDFDLHIGNVFVGQLLECSPPSLEIESTNTYSANLILNNTSNYDTCIVEYTEIENTSWDNATTDTISNLYSSYVITNLQPNHSYKIRGKSLCSSLQSNYSSTQVFTTLCNYDTITDTIEIHDTIYRIDTVLVTLYDTIQEIDTVFLVQYDTISLIDTIFDTIYIYDTITECGISRTNIYATIGFDEVYQEYGFNVSEAGEYCQTLQTENNCDSIVCLHLSSYSNIQTIEEKEHTFCYPNPAHDKIYIEGSGEITIIDNFGKIILKENSNKRQRIIDIKDFDSGVYYLKVGSSTQKIIIQK